jgi:hypothetical protein
MMAKQMRTASTWETTKIPVQAKLAAAWASFMFLYVYVDILNLYMPGVIDDIRGGVVSAFQVSQTWAVGALVLMAIPLLMIVLSLTLPARVNRWANLAVASLYFPVSIANVVGESWTYFFALGAVLEVAVLAAVLRWAWTWPKASTVTREHVNADQPRHTIHA